MPEFNDDAPCHPTVNLQISANPTQVTIQPGSFANVQILTRDLNAPQANKPKNGNTVVLRSVFTDTPPSGTSAVIDPSGVTPTYEGALSLLRINIPSTASPGSFNMAVAGTIGTCIKSATVRVTVGQAVSEPFRVVPLATTTTIARGSSGLIPFRVYLGTVAVAAKAPVSLSLVLRDPQFIVQSHRLDPAVVIPTTAGTDAMLDLTVGASTPLGTYDLALRGRDGVLQHDGDFTVIVTEGEPR